MYKVAIVLLNHNGLTLLKQYLPPLLTHSNGHSIIIVDNASTDGSLAYIENHFPQVACIRHKKNHGIAKGYNLALCQINATYYLLLNNDVLVTENWLEPLLTLMETDPIIAFCQPKIRSLTATDQFDYAGAAGGFIDQNGYPFCRGRIFHHIEKDQGQYNDTRAIFWASGACFMARATAFHALGGFDEVFFAHFEEIDLCWRAHLAGWQVYYCSKSLVYHVGGATIAYTSSKKTYLNFRNRALMLYKYRPSYNMLIKRLLLDSLAILHLLFLGKVAHSWAICKAQIAFFRLKKRHMVPFALLQPLPYQYRDNIVVDFFFKKKQLFSKLSPTKFS